MEDKNEAARKIIVALDVENEKEAYDLVKLLSPPVSCYKVGMRLYTACGPRIIQGLKELGVKVFLDLKFHDIPNTVASTVEVAAGFGIEMFNIHLSGGREMMEPQYWIRQMCKAAGPRRYRFDLLKRKNVKR